MKSTVSKKRPTVNRNNDLEKLRAELVAGMFATIVQVVLWMYQMACQQNVPRWVGGASTMSKYEHSGKNSKKSQPIGRTATDAKSSLGQLKESPTTERIASRLTEASTWSEELTVANPDNSGSLLRSFAGSSLVTNVLLLVIIVFLIAAAVVWLLFTCKRTTFNKNWKKNRKYNRVHDTEQPESLNEETSDDDSNEDVLTETNLSDPLTTSNLKDTKLSELPPNLEDLLIKKLDVPCEGERLYGWQKVGKAFKIPSDDLKYFNIEYKRDNGSPTSKLLLRLGISNGKTVSDLVNVLTSPKVNLPVVASLLLRSRGSGE